MPARVDADVARVARATARRLSVSYGSQLETDIEAALRQGDREPPSDRFGDPLALASLIVSIATLGWTIYTDVRHRGAQARDAVERRVRVAVRESDGTMPAEQDHIIAIVVDEIIRDDRDDC